MLDQLTSRLDLRRVGREPLTQQLTAQLRDLILGGQVSGGQSLPSSRALASALKVSRNTVTTAIEQLTAEGYLDASRGRRPIVRSLEALPAGPSPQKGKTGTPPRLAKWATRLTDARWLPGQIEPLRPLRRSSADPREFPHDIWARYLRRAARRRGDDDPAFNRRTLQSALCAHLAAYRGVTATPDQVLLLPTAQAGLALISSILIEAGDTAWVESPGYGGAGAAFSAAGARVVGIPLDVEGIDFSTEASSPRVIFTTPSHQFPTGRLMTMNRRIELLRFAEARGAWVIEDDYDGEFHYDDRPTPCLQGLDTSDRVLYLGTFSKTMFSGIRVGYIVVPTSLIDLFTLAQRHLGALASAQVQDALADFIADGLFLSQIRKARRLYRSRRDHLATALERRFDRVFAVERPAGGMQLVAWCRGRIEDTDLSARCAAAGVVTEPLSGMFVGKPARNGLLFGFAGWREGEIDEALRKMQSALE